MSQAQLQSAMQLHRAGQLDQAEAAYRHILAVRSPTIPTPPPPRRHPGPTRGRHQEAETLIRKAIALALPPTPEYYRNLAISMLQTNRPDDAIACFLEACRSNCRTTRSLRQPQPTQHALRQPRRRRQSRHGRQSRHVPPTKNLQYIGNLGIGYIVFTPVRPRHRRAEGSHPIHPQRLASLARGSRRLRAESRQFTEALHAFDHLLKLQPNFRPRLQANRSARSCASSAAPMNPSPP